MKRSTGKSNGILPNDTVPILLGAALAGLFSVLYGSTLAPTVLYQDSPRMFDSVMLQAAVPVLGVGHPTGYPTYMMMAHLFTYIPLGDAAYRVNLFSAVFGVVSVVMLYMAGLRLTRSAVAATAGALAFGLTPIFWSQAVIAEVYTLNVAFIASILYVLLLWRDSGRNRHLLLAAFLLGLSLTHHLTSALLIPAALLFVYLTDRGRLREAHLWIKSLGLFALGLTPYVYLPIRAAMNAPLNEADPSNLERFLLLVSGGSFLLKNLLDVTGGGAQGEASGGSGMAPWPAVEGIASRLIERLSPTGEYVLGQFPALVLLAGLMGVFYLLYTDRKAAVLLGALFAGWLVLPLVYTVADFYVFFIPAYSIFGLFVAYGVKLLLRKPETLARMMPARTGILLVAVVCVAVLAVPLARTPHTYAKEDQSNNYRGRTILNTVATETAADATILHHRSSLWYLVLVEHRRRDLTLVDPFKTSWVRHKDLVWPADLNARQSAARYGTGDPSGVKAARIAAKHGPVYLLNQDTGQMGDFEAAGFRVKPVGNNGVLYKLVPRKGSGEGQAP